MTNKLSYTSAVLAVLAFASFPANASNTPVVVQNTVANPIPTVVSNTVSAPVNAKIVNSSASPVEVQGPVSVTNTIANPVGVQISNSQVPTSDVNKAAHVPFSKRFDVVFSSGSGNATLTVPAGQRLVITYISCDVGTFPGAHVLFDLATINAGAEVEAHLPMADQGVILGQQVFATSCPMMVFADPNSTVTVAFLDSDSAHSGGAIVGIYGYLVSATAASFE